jgi:hypothetical protein
MRTYGLVLFAIFTTLCAYSQQRQSCKGNPELVGECYKIHGRVRVGNGIGITIWHIGTDRLSGIDDGNIIIPDNLADAIYHDGQQIYGRDVFGDFEVCPFTKRKPGRMQMVCVESASHLVIKENKQ